jgi:DNA-binding NtrC family response regulator
MLLLLVDDTRELAFHVESALAPYQAQIECAHSPGTLEAALGSTAPYDLILVNLTETVAGWDLPARLRQSAPAAFTVVLFDPHAPAHVEPFSGLSQCRTVARPSSPALFGWLFGQIAAECMAFARLLAAPTGTACSETIIGKSKKMLDVLAVVSKVAASNANVCIVGESGTGKELIARAVHYASARRDRPLVTLDCPAVPDGLMESHLFGHVKGAFTGAVDHREGVFALAHTGTLFIDELCELGLPLQAKLLRVLQSREFFKVGGTKPIRTDIRLIAATNKDPKRAVERGTFREDLYYRVAVVVIKVPSLRERTEDIPLMVEHFVRKFSTAYNKPIRGVTPAAMEHLLESPWPGNVRQLENVVEQAVVLAEGATLSERDFLSEPDLFAEESSGEAPPVQPEPGQPLDEVERRHILGTLQKVHGNRTEAARLLGISLRCLQYKLKAYREDEPVVLPSNVIRFSGPLKVRGSVGARPAGTL